MTGQDLVLTPPHNTESVCVMSFLFLRVFSFCCPPPLARHPKRSPIFPRATQRLPHNERPSNTPRQTQPTTQQTLTTEAGQDTDAFVAKLDGGNGTRLWGWQGGSVGNDYANAVAVDPRGDVYACGAAPRGMFVGDQPQAGGEAGTGAGAGETGAEGQVGNVWSNDDGGGAVADMFVAKVGSAFCLLVSTKQKRNSTATCSRLVSLCDDARARFRSAERGS